MSIELMEATKEWPNDKWHVRPNYCKCHPETCCCRDYAVHEPNGNKYDTFSTKSIAQDIVDMKNFQMENKRK